MGATEAKPAVPGASSQLHVDLARVAAMASVVLLHSTAQPPPVTMDASYVFSWWTWNIWSSVAWIGVPLFIMISGALLLRPEKADEPMGVFFRRRWKRIGLPFIFWGAAYVLWSIFVDHSVVNLQFVLNSVVAGPYFQFWYLYMLIGLYLATPMLRVLVTYMPRKMFKYLLIIWFVGILLQPVWNMLYAFNPNSTINLSLLFYFTGYLGCFLFGGFLREAKVQSKLPYLLLGGGLVWSILGNYFVSGTLGMGYNFIIWGNLTANVIVTTTALFLILTKIKYTNPIFSLISQNTLSIYLFHVMILEAFERGYFGFVISASYIPVAIEFPLMATATLFVTLLIVAPLKKLPVINRFI
jgi:surface polysaccharide O-acyltransferase-like enzyme